MMPETRQLAPARKLVGKIDGDLPETARPAFGLDLRSRQSGASV